MAYINALNKIMRVANLYRVSTNKQLDDNDIPMQETACKKLISQHSNWHLVDEYIEKGVSGYKTKIKDRDVIQQILTDAQRGLFDILVIFASDRLCRIADDYTPVLKKLSKHVEIWSYTQGDITIRTHTDALKASIDGWQNEGESIKISLRTDEKHKQMTTNGEFRGGSNPYGYKFVKSGRYNKRDKKQRKELYDLVIDKKESEIVKKIFVLAYEYGYGGNRIAKYLNNKSIPTRNYKKWSMSTINYMLRNPIYKGYYSYGKKTCKDGQINQPKDKWILSDEKNENLAIIDERIWDKVQLIRKQRNPENANNNTVPTKSHLLFVGFIKCGYCESPLVTTHHNKKWTNKDGTVRSRTTYKYRCSGKQSGKFDCEGRSIYAQNKIEEPVLRKIKEYMKQLGQCDVEKEVNTIAQKDLKNASAELKILIEKREEKYQNIEVLEEEIPKALRNKSPYSNDELSNLIKKEKLNLKTLKDKIAILEEKINNRKIEIKDIVDLKNIAQNWDELFDQAPIDKKKMILASLIKNIDVFIVDNNLAFKIKIKIHVDEFVKHMLGVHYNTKWESA